MSVNVPSPTGAAVAIAAVAAVLLSAAVPSPARAEEETPRLRGKVVDAASGEPISGATVHVSVNERRTLERNMTVTTSWRCEGDSNDKGLYDFELIQEG